MSTNSELKNNFNSVLLNFMEPYSGWCGSAKGAGNILLGQDISSGYDINLISSPYQIPDTYSLLNLENTINLKTNSVTLDDPARTTLCSSNQIMNQPCFGGLNASGSWSLDAGCDGNNPSYTYPTTSRLPQASKYTLPEIIDHNTGKKITLGSWVKASGWGPKQQKTSMADVSSWTGKLNFSTSILSSNKVALGNTGTTPSVAKIYINIVSSTLKNTGLLGSKENIKLLCDYVATTIPRPQGTAMNAMNTANRHINTINRTSSTIDSRISQIQALVYEAPAAMANPLIAVGWLAYATDMVTTFKSYVDNYVSEVEVYENLYFSAFPPILKNMCKFYKSQVNFNCSSKSGFLEINKIICQYRAHKEYSLQLLRLSGKWRDNNKDFLKSSVYDVYTKALANNITLFDSSLVFYKPVSVAYTLVNRCSMISSGTGNGNGSGSFPFAKVGGICTMDGCSASGSSTYCSCNSANTNFICPFELQENNLTKCQASIITIPSGTDNTNANNNMKRVQAIELMRKNILYWFNTMVGTNGCFQRSLGMKYGKCINFNGTSLSVNTWSPSNNKFNISAKANTNLFNSQ